MQPAISVNVNNLTPAQFAAIHKILTSADQESEVEVPAKRAKKSKPAPIVSDDEDEDFAKSPLKARELEEDEEIEEDSEAEDEDEGEDEQDEEPSVTFAEVKAAINKYGEKHPDQMRAILLGFNIKGPKELSAKGNEKYWDPVYRKVMAKLKASKKGK